MIHSEITSECHIVWLVVIRRIELTIIHKHSLIRVIRTKQYARVSVADPSVQFSSWFFHQHFNAISLSIGVYHIGLDIVIEEEYGAGLVIEVVLYALIINFDGGLDCIRLKVLVEA